MRKLCLFIAAASMLALSAQAQQTVTGKITDSSGAPLTGATVTYEGTNIGTSADKNGVYTIKAVQDGELTFAFFGMKPQTIPVGGRTVINVQLESDDIYIDDVVIIGYGELNRRDLTGSVSSIKSEDIMRSGSNNVFGALQGQVPGLSITSQSGEPGSGFSIKIRGNNSINAGTTPLFVIDGMQMDLSSSEVAHSSATGSGTYDPLSFINPADIESIDVLKDASATAIYGARGANGVVIITTKSGAANIDKTVVTLDASVGVSFVPKYLDMINGQEYINYRFARGDYGYTGYGVDTDNDGEVDTPLDATPYKQYDWQKLLYRPAVTQNYNASVSAMVGKKTSILASLGYLNQDGLIINNNYERYTGRLKADHHINKKLSVGMSVNYGRNISNGAVASGGGSLGSSGLIQLIYLERPIELYTDADTDYSLGYTSLLDMVSAETYRKTVYSRTAGNAYLNWEIIPDLKLRVQAAGNQSNSLLREFYSVKSRWGRSRNGYGRQQSVDSYGWNASAQLNYKKTWNEAHNFDAMLGGELSAYQIENFSLSAMDFLDDSTGAFNLSKGGNIEAPSQSVSKSTLMSAFMRMNYNYKQRYYLTFNMRADGSSKFYPGHRWGYFPSASVAWRINEESFLKSADWLDNLKLRASAGITGNDRVSTYAALALMTVNYYAINGQEVMGMAPSSSANSNLKWETTYQYNIGLDVGLFGGRVNLSGDIYYKDTRDMLYRAVLSAQTGFTEQWQNLGRVDNKGLEIALNTHNIERPNFSWSTNISFDMSRNKVRDIGGVSYTSVNISNGILTNDISRIMVGQPIGVGYGYVWDGNYQLDDFIITDRYGNVFPSSVVTSDNMKSFTYTLKDGVTRINSMTVQPGDRKYKDLTGDNEVTAEDRQVISNSNPKFTMSMGNTLNFYNFDLTFFFEGVYGRDIMNEFKIRSESGLSGSTHFNALRREAWKGHWTPENGSQTYSRLLNQSNTWVSSYCVEDGSFIRFKTLALGYTFNSKALQRVRIKSIRLYASVDNIWVWTKYGGMDPDVSSSNVLFTGFDRMSYPKARTFTFGINANF